MATLHTLTLTTLADSIKESASTLQSLLTQHQLPQPDFSPTGRKDWSDAQFVPAILTARSHLIDNAQTLLNLALGPTDILAAYAGSRMTEIEVLRTFNSLAVAEAVPIYGQISVPDLARKLGVKQVSAFEKQLRFAYLMGMFRQTDDGEVAHTALSAAIPESSAWIGLRLGKIFNQGAYEIADALRLGPGEGKTNIPCAIVDPKGLARTAYLQLEDEPDGKGMDRFSTAMKDLFNHHAGGSLLPFVHGFDWDSLGREATVVDIGGGNGHIEAGIADQVPGVNFVVQDRQSNEEPARQLIEANGLTGRVQFQAHDFFHPQPNLPDGRTPNAYLLIRVLQDWEDPDGVRIIKPLVPAMEKFGTKLWIMNRILPDVGELPNHSERLLRTLDLLVFTLSGGGERTAKDLDRMLKQADERLRITKITRPLNSLFSFIEIVLQ
ncbi:hypothetical protein RRF57_005152 [Xylaria bambusicola]|uniref:O-methyltransferase C-terminal domain-containing protein n=1 Tax=Xylaria bambusicola TaxID=326684 RepID=A0AAN7Z5I7_9PEZI